MLDAVVYIDVCNVKAPRAVRAVQDVRDESWHIKTGRRRKVVGRADVAREPPKRDIAPVVRDLRHKDDGRTVIGHRIEWRGMNT